MNRKTMTVNKLMAFLVCWFALVGEAFALGQVGGVYQIGNCKDLKDFSTLVNTCSSSGSGKNLVYTCANSSANAILTADITSCSGFTPIGSATKQDGSNKGSAIKDVYKGIFDGQGYTISNLSISSDNHYVGLFGYVNGGTIKNLKVENSTVTRTGDDAGWLLDPNGGTPYYVGVVVGYMKSGTVTGVATENASVAGSDVYYQNWSSGGIAGYNGGTISECSVVGGAIKGRTEVGGIAGTNTGTITDCLASPDVLSGSILLVTGIGGIAGKNDGTISRVVYTGDRVSNTENNSRVTGGPITGSGSRDCVSQCYYTENVGLVPTGGDAQESDIDKIKEELGYPWDVGDGSLIIVNSVYYYTVTIHPNGHGSQQTLSVKKNQKIESLDSIMVGGFKRIGLCKDAGCTQNWDFSNDRVTSDTTLYAKWAQAYTVTFTIGTLADGETGSFPSGATTMKYCVPGEKITADGITSPTFASGVLAGWSRADDGTVDADLGTMGSEAITVYAIENISNVVNITYKPGSYGTGSELTQKAVPGVTVNLKGNLFTRTNYAQDGWSRSNDGNKAYELNQSITVPADSLTLYPHWKQTTVKIEYKYSESSASDPSGKTIDAAYKSEDADFDLTNETFTREGYRQDGWSLVYGGNKSYDLGAPYNVNQATTFYPHWIQIFTVTFNANNHGTAPDAVTVDAGSKITEPEVPWAEGYTFNGWNTKDDGTGVTWDFNTNTVTANTTLYAIWIPDSYTITYYPGENGTGSIDPGTKTYGVDFTLSSDKFTRTGYTQTGWATTDGGAQVYELGGSYTADAAITLYPVWQINSHLVQYKVDGEVWSSSSAEYHATVTPPTAPAKTGYTFKQWTSAQVEWSQDLSTFTMIDEAVVVTAEYEVNNYALTWNIGANAVVGADTYTTAGDVPYGTTLTAPTVTRAGYRFDGWTPNVPATMPASASSFTATWTPVGYTITYNNLYEGQTNANPASYTIESETITLQNPGDSTGYTFGGWYADDEFEDAAITEIAQGSTENKTLYAKWTVKTHSITYQYSVDGGETYQNAGADPETVNFGTSQTRRQTYVLDGYTMSAWTVSPDTLTIAENGTFIMPDMDVVFKTTGAKNNYTIAYFIGDTQVGDAVSVEFDGTVTPKDTSKTGYTFSGWTWYSLADVSNPAKLDEVPATMPAYNLKAVGTFTPKSLTVAFDANNGAFAEGAVTSKSVDYDAAITAEGISEPSREGYAFKGWARASDATVADASLGTMDSEEGVTFYAVWVQTFTVTFNKNGHGADVESQIIELNSTATEPSPAPTENGYTFAGWYVATDFTGSAYNFGSPVTASVVLNAKWTVQVTFDMNGHGTDIAAQTVTVGKAATSPTAPTANGFRFDGWFADDETFQNAYDFANTPVTAAIELHAKWTAIPVVVNIVGSSSSVTYDGTEQSVEGYEVTSITCDGVACGDVFTAANVALKTGVSASAAGTNAGLYSMGLSAASFETKNTAYTAVTFNVTDGALTIGKKAVTFKGTSATEIYTGSLIINAEFTVDGLVDGHTHNVVASVQGTEVSATAYAGEITAKGDVKIEDASQNDVTANYEITTTPGSLTIKKAAGLTVALEGATYTYDANAKALTAVATTNAKSGTTTIEYQFDGDAEWTATLASLTKVAAGTYTVNVRATNPNYSNTAENTATLTINKAEITIAVVGASNSTVYDRNEHSVTGYTPSCSNTLYDASKVVFGGTASAARTELGTTNMGLKADDFSYNDENITATFKITDGYQTITAANEVIVTITGHSSTVTYNGATQEVSGYDFVADNALYTASDVEFTSSAVASGMVAGTYSMGLTSSMFTNKNENFSKVTFKVTDGSLTILKIATPVVITADGAAKTYDGAALTKSSYTFTQNVILASDALTATVSGTIADAGTADNVVSTYKVMNGETDVTNCYTFGESVKGTLTVNKAPLSVKTESATRAYDGTPLTAGASIVSGLVGEETATIAATGSQTIVGTSDNTYEITWGTAKEDNYEVSASIGTLEVTAAAITITANDQFYTYNGAAQGVAATTDVEGTTISYCDAAGENCSATVPQLTNADTVTVTVKATKANYADAEKTYKLGVAKKAVTITVTAAEKTYGDTDPTFTGKVEGLVAATDLGTIAYVRTDVATDVNVGTYTDKLTATFTENANYTVSVTPATFTINQLEATLAWSNTEFDYDGAEHVPTATVSNLVGTDECTVTVTGAASTAGEHTATASALGNTNYKLPTSATQKFNIKAGTFAVTLSAESATYNGAAQVPTVTVKDGGKTLELGTDYTVAWDNSGFTNAGNYEVTVTGANNYTGEVKRTYTINPKAVVVKATAAQKTYGEADPTLASSVEGLVTGESETLIARTVTRATGENVGAYTITASGEASQGNYSVTYETATFTIAKAAVTVKADDKEQVYGAAATALTATVTGKPESGDAVNYTLSRAEGDDVGEYAISVNLGENPNYEITTTSGTYTIKKATFTVAGTNYEDVYDGARHGAAAVPTVTEGTTVSYKVGEGDWSTTAPTIKDVGEISVSVKAENANYETATNSYTLKVTPKAAVVKATAAQKTYGETDPTLASSVEGLVTGESETLIARTVTRATGENVGTYTITASGDASQGNYSVTYETATFTINKKAVTITVASAEKTYGENDPTFTGSVDGLVAATDLGTIAYVRSGTDESVGSYVGVIVATYTANDNYEVTVQNGSFAINPVVDVKLPENVELVCTAGATGAENCTEDGKSIDHTYGEETSPLPGSVVVDSNGAVDTAWHFTGWFENEDGIAPEVTKIDAEEENTVTIYPFFEKTINVIIGEDTIQVVIDNNDVKDSIDQKTTDAIRSAGIEDPTKPDDYMYTYEFEKYEYNAQTGKVTPVFTHKGREYKIAYDMPATAALSKDIRKYSYGERTKLPEAYIDGDDSWDFKGWYTKPNGLGTRVKVITEKEFGNKKFYAMIQKEIVYEVNGTKGQLIVVYSESAEASIRKALNSVIPADYVEDGVTYTFESWTKTGDGSYKAVFVDAATGLRGAPAPHFSVVADGRSLEIINAKIGSAVVVYDMRGKIVTRGLVDNATQRIDLVNPGSYIVRVNNQTVRVNVR